MQYATLFSCPDCSEHTFETEAELVSEKDLTNSTCTNCGHVLEAGEIAEQAKSIPSTAIRTMIENARTGHRKYAGH